MTNAELASQFATTTTSHPELTSARYGYRISVAGNVVDEANSQNLFVLGSITKVALVSQALTQTQLDTKVPINEDQLKSEFDQAIKDDQKGDPLVHSPLFALDKTWTLAELAEASLAYSSNIAIDWLVTWLQTQDSKVRDQIQKRVDQLVGPDNIYIRGSTQATNKNSHNVGRLDKIQEVVGKILTVDNNPWGLAPEMVRQLREYLQHTANKRIEIGPRLPGRLLWEKAGWQENHYKADDVELVVKTKRPPLFYYNAASVLAQEISDHEVGIAYFVDLTSREKLPIETQYAIEGEIIEGLIGLIAKH